MLTSPCVAYRKQLQGGADAHAECSEVLESVELAEVVGEEGVSAEAS
jgi:hypothetical protein